MKNTDDEYEAAFSEFLDCQEYDDVSEYLFQVTRAAFREGWKAAAIYYTEKWSHLKVLPDLEEMPKEESVS